MEGRNIDPWIVVLVISEELAHLLLTRDPLSLWSRLAKILSRAMTE